MKSRLAITVITGAALLAQSSGLVSFTPGVKANPSELAGNSPSLITPPESDKAARMRVSEAYGKLPLSFEENRGQTDRQVKFLSRGKGYTLLLTPAGAVLSLLSEKAVDSEAEKTRLEKRETQSAVLRMKLVGANTSPQIEGREPLQGKSNYLIGNDRKKWHTEIPRYAQVRYDQIYPGIDLVYYGTSQRQLEYDFLVAPGADASAIRLNFDGADEIKLDADGSLRLKLKGGEVTQPAPVIYQKTEGGEKQQVAGHYVLKGDGEVSFEIADYDRSRELVIDPQLLYATFYGGSGDDVANDIAVDGSGNAYITGETTSPNLLLRSAFQGVQNPGGSPGPDNSDAFVTKLNASGTDIVYSTYLGGNLSDQGNAIAVTGDGRACVTGQTGNGFESAGNFPTTSNRFQGDGGFFDNRELDAFVTILSANGSSLFYSTYFAGNRNDSAGDDGQDEGLGIAVDSSGKVYVTGITDSKDLPMKNAFQNKKSGGNNEAFIAKFDPTQAGPNSLIYSSFLGGGGGEFANDIAVTPAGVAFIVGVTGSFNYPTKSSSSLPPFQTTQGGVNDSFIAKVSPSGALIYSTYFGGNDRDEAESVAVDSEERAYVTGSTVSNAATFPLKNAFQPNRIGAGDDAFVAKFNADGTALFYSSFLGGGNFNNVGRSIAIDAGGNAYVVGFTAPPTGFSSVNGFPSSVPPGATFVAKIEAQEPTGTTIPKILYLDNFGGNSANANAIAVDGRGNVYIAGSTGPGFTTTTGAFQETFNGGNTSTFGHNSDAFVAKIGSTFPDTIGVFHPPSSARPVDDFRLRNSNTAGPPDLIADFGQAGDQALAGDWNGDGVDDVGVFRPSTAQFLLRQPTRLQTGIVIDVTLTLNFGLTGDKAVVGDWNGDGIDTPGLFRNGQWLLTNGPNTNNTTPPIDLIFNFGAAGASPVAGDWNGDGIDSIGTFNAGAWALRNSNSSGAADVTAIFGEAPGNQPLVGDWNGDGIDSQGVLVPSNIFGATTFVLNNVNVTPTAFDLVFAFGADGDLPVSGNWDGKPGNTPPNSGVNNPSEGLSRVGQTQVFTTTCSDPDGWHDIHTIDFKIARSNGNGQGVPIAVWAQFDENQNLIRLYDPDLKTWFEGAPGANLVLENGYVQLRLAGTSVLGSGPLGPSVQVRWEVTFKNPATGKNYKQYLKITDDAGSSTGFDDVGSWSVLK